MGESMKNVLFISIDFYYYTKEIVEEMKRQGLNVFFFDCRPQLSSYQKFKVEKFPSYRKKIMDRHVERILTSCQGTAMDLVLLNSTIYFSKEQIQRLLSAFPSAPHLWYFWDSVSNFSYVRDYPSLFDKAYSFDKNDCEKYHSIYQPTFYDPTCLAATKGNPHGTPVISFIGSANPRRYVFLKNIKRSMEKQGISCAFYLYFRNKATYRFRRLTNRAYRGSTAKEFIFTPLDAAKKAEVIANSDAVIDFPYQDQGGLTMRAIEAAVMGKKYITTSSEIQKYDLYNPDNVALISEKDYSPITKEFLSKSWRSLSVDPAKEYSVSSFVQHLVLENLAHV